MGQVSARGPRKSYGAAAGPQRALWVRLAGQAPVPVGQAAGRAPDPVWALPFDAAGRLVS